MSSNTKKREKKGNRPSMRTLLTSQHEAVSDSRFVVAMCTQHNMRHSLSYSHTAVRNSHRQGDQVYILHPMFREGHVGTMMFNTNYVAICHTNGLWETKGEAWENDNPPSSSHQHFQRPLLTRARRSIQAACTPHAILHPTKLR